MTQEGDVLLFQTNDEGEILVENGLVLMSGGLETAAYLSLFGGNEDDDGSQDNTANWWGNLDEADPASQYRSETQFLLKSLPFSVSNLNRVRDAVNRDLAWFVEKGVATEVSTEVTIPGLNKLKISGKITANGQESDFVFIENWKADK